MIRAVLDANVFASGVLRYHTVTSTPAVILHSREARGIELILTPDPQSRQ